MSNELPDGVKEEVIHVLTTCRITYKTDEGRAAAIGYATSNGKRSHAKYGESTSHTVTIESQEHVQLPE